MTNRRKLILLGLLWLIAGCGRAPAAIQATPGASPAPESIAASPTPPTAAPAGANDPPPAPPAAPTATPADPPPLTEGPHWIAVMDYWEPEESSVRLVDIHTGRIAETHECYAIDMRMVDWSPDGRWLTCTLSFLHSIVTLADTTNLSTTLDLTPDGIRDTPLPVLDWSPDRSQVAISTGAAIAVFPLDGGAYRELVRCAPARCSSVAWSPDGRWLAYGHDDAVRIIDLNGGPGPETSLGIVERPPDTGSPEGAPPAIDPLVWSPDSARVAYVTAAGVFVLSVADGKALQLIDHATAGYWVDRVGWSADGAMLDMGTYDSRRVTAPGDGSAPPSATEPWSDQAATYAHDDRFEKTTADGRCFVELRQDWMVELPASGPDPAAPVPLYDLVASYEPLGSEVVLLEGVSNLSTGLRVAPAGGSAPALSLAEPAMRGCAVLELQSSLFILGYDRAAETGVYGEDTAAAVRAFQADHGLPATGAVDLETWRALRSAR